ncbi:MAG: hypothetical protein J6R85_02310 [Lentisphaeria bacterium]|nr:hypothetical protein [Lentisphaeria bacterium]
MLRKIVPAALLGLCMLTSLFGAEEKRIVCFGDSLTSCGGKGGKYSDMLQKSLPAYKFINSGKGGDTIGGGLARLEEAVLKHRAQYLVIGLGANDYWRRKRTLNDLKKDYDTILSRCAAAGMKIVIISCFGNDKLPPDTRIDFDKAGIPLEHYAVGIATFERELAKKYHAEYVPDMQCSITPKGRKDLWSDSNHPNAAGNRIVADTILPALQKILQQDPPKKQQPAAAK